MVEMTSTGENRSTQTEPVPSPLCPPQIPWPPLRRGTHQVTSAHVTKTNGEVEVQIFLFLSCKLDRMKSQVQDPAILPSVKVHCYPLNWRLCGPRSRSVCYRKEVDHCLCNKNQQNAQFYINGLIYLTVFDMFLTSKCSSSGRLEHAVLWYFVHVSI